MMFLDASSRPRKGKQRVENFTMEQLGQLITVHQAVKEALPWNEEQFKDEDGTNHKDGEGLGVNAKRATMRKDGEEEEGEFVC